MKLTRLTFFEVRNRIVVGLCHSFSYKDHAHWRVKPGTLRVARISKNGISIEAYMYKNRGILGNPEYSVEVVRA